MDRADFAFTRLETISLWEAGGVYVWKSNNCIAFVFSGFRGVEPRSNEWKVTVFSPEIIARIVSLDIARMYAPCSRACCSKVSENFIRKIEQRPRITWILVALHSYEVNSLLWIVDWVLSFGIEEWIWCIRWMQLERSFMYGVEIQSNFWWNIHSCSFERQCFHHRVERKYCHFSREEI